MGCWYGRLSSDIPNKGSSTLYDLLYHLVFDFFASISKALLFWEEGLEGEGEEEMGRIRGWSWCCSF